MERSSFKPCTACIKDRLLEEYSLLYFAISLHSNYSFDAIAILAPLIKIIARAGGSNVSDTVLDDWGKIGAGLKTSRERHKRVNFGTLFT